MDFSASGPGQSAASPQDTRKRPSGANALNEESQVSALLGAPPQVRIRAQAFRFNV